MFFFSVVKPKLKPFAGGFFIISAVLYFFWVLTILKTSVPGSPIPRFLPDAGIILNSGIIVVGMLPVMGKVMGLFHVLAMLPVIILFFKEVATNPEKRIKTRSLLLGFGFIFGILNAFSAHYVASEIMSTAYAYFVSIAYLLILGGILYKVQSTLPTESRL